MEIIMEIFAIVSFERTDLSREGSNFFKYSKCRKSTLFRRYKSKKEFKNYLRVDTRAA